MPTQAQIDANRRNAQSSTGPRTEAGKANSSRNATKFGLFATNNCVLPGDEEAYDYMCHSLWDALAPVGPLEEVAAAEYVRASWLLRRCALAEQTLGNFAIRESAALNRASGKEGRPTDPMMHDDFLPNVIAVGRARAQAQNSRVRAKAELDKLQTERRARPQQTDADSQIQPVQVEPKPEATPAPAPEPAAEKAPVTEPSQSAPVPQPEPPGRFPCSTLASERLLRRAA